MAILIHHQHPQAVARFQYLHGRRVVRSAVGVGTHLLELFYLVNVDPVRQGDAHSCEVIVEVDSVDLHVFTVEEEPVPVEAEIPDPQRRLVPVGDAPPALNRSLYRI